MTKVDKIIKYLRKMKHMAKKLSPDIPSQCQVSFDNEFFMLKELNAKTAALQLLAQDYDIKTMPQWVGFTTTNACNLKCPHCQTHGTEEMRKIYNLQRWDNNTLERIPKESLPYAYAFCLTLNGEPLCTPGIRERLDEWSKYGAKLHLTTNGTLFSKKMMATVLPIVGTISISIDGATKITCEAIRLGTSFKKLSNNIRLLTRTCELLPEISPDIRLAFTVMASNVRDMPELVKLAHVLKVPAIDFYPFVALFPHVHDEDMKLHKPLYNYYAEKTQEEAKRLNIIVSMPNIFPGIAGNENASNIGAEMIIKQLPPNYYATLPSPESFLNHHDIEEKATEIAEIIKNVILKTDDNIVDADIRDIFLQDIEQFNTLLKKHRIWIKRLSELSECTNYCEDLFKRIFISHEGNVSPCCHPGRPGVGNINEHTIKEIWNGNLYNNFRKEFYSSNPPDCCKDCPSLTQVPKQNFLTSLHKDFK